MNKKPWISTEIFTQAEQVIKIQPTPEFDGIEVYTGEMDCPKGPTYITMEELPIIIQKLQEMMDYVMDKI